MLIAGVVSALCSQTLERGAGLDFICCTCHITKHFGEKKLGGCGAGLAIQNCDCSQHVPVQLELKHTPGSSLVLSKIVILRSKPADLCCKCALGSESSACPQDPNVHAAGGTPQAFSFPVLEVVNGQWWALEVICWGKSQLNPGKTQRFRFGAAACCDFLA